MTRLTPAATRTISTIRAMRTQIDRMGATRGTRADHRITLEQIGRGALMNLGARDVIHDDENGKVTFTIGRSRKAIVTLTPADLYHVEIGRVKRGTYEWVSEITRDGIGAEQLAETLITMHHEAAYG